MKTDRRGPLPAGEESFAAVAEHAPALLWRGDAEGRCVYLNRAQREFWGVRAEEVASFSWATTLLPEDAPNVFGPFAEGMKAQRAFACEGRYRRADGAIRLLETRAEPRFDGQGVFTGMVGVNIDITDERNAQSELSESEARLRALADNLPYGMIFQIVSTADGAKRFSFVSSRCEALNGVKAEIAQADPASLYNLILPEYREAFTAAEAEARRNFRGFNFETPMRRADGEVRWFRIASAPRHGANGDVIWDGVQVDIHDRKIAEKRQRLLMSEMSHRIKNNLATVTSIAMLTARGANSVEAFNTSFQARLRALSKTHDLLTGAGGDFAELRDILEAELYPYVEAGGGKRRLQLDGPPVRVAAQAAVNVSLVIHELATNAAKYGAYAADGAVEVSWMVDVFNPGSPVRLMWRESGGPAVTASENSGFGSRLIERLLTHDLGGAITPRYAPGGFEADLTFLASGKRD